MTYCVEWDVKPYTLTLDQNWWHWWIKGDLSKLIYESNLKTY